MSSWVEWMFGWGNEAELFVGKVFRIRPAGRGFKAKWQSRFRVGQRRVFRVR